MSSSVRRAVRIALLAGCALALLAGTAAAQSMGGSGTTGTSSTGASGATGPSSKPKVVSCPVSVASAGVSSAQWLWSAYGAPRSSASTVTYSQTIGQGTWTRSKAKGTICSEDQGGGEPKRSIVLAVSGSSKLSPGMTEGGVLGIGITLHVKVKQSGDPAVCPVGATGSVALFASYYSVHKDAASMRFAGTCSAWDETFGGSILHVKISNDGAMIRPGQ